MKYLALLIVLVWCSINLADAQLGLRPFLRPFVRPFARPFARPFVRPILRPFGKREINFNTSVVLDEDDITFLNETASSVCIYTTLSNVFSCFSKNETFDCPAVPRFLGLENISVKLTNLVLTPTEDTGVLNFLEKERNFTLRTPSTEEPIVVSLKNFDDFTEPGLLVENKDCWSLIEKLLARFQTVSLRLNLIL